MSNLSELLTKKDGLVSVVNFSSYKLISEIINEYYKFCRECDVSSKESYIKWVDEWQNRYKELTKIIREYKHYRKLIHAMETYEYVNFKPKIISPDRDTYWFMNPEKDIYRFHTMKLSFLDSKLSDLSKLATLMLHFRRQMKDISWKKKQLDRHAVAA